MPRVQRIHWTLEGLASADMRLLVTFRIPFLKSQPQTATCSFSNGSMRVANRWRPDRYRRPRGVRPTPSVLMMKSAEKPMKY